MPNVARNTLPEAHRKSGEKSGKDESCSDGRKSIYCLIGCRMSDR